MARAQWCAVTFNNRSRKKKSPCLYFWPDSTLKTLPPEPLSSLSPPTLKRGWGGGHAGSGPSRPTHSSLSLCARRSDSRQQEPRLVCGSVFHAQVTRLLPLAHMSLETSLWSEKCHTFLISYMVALSIVLCNSSMKLKG